MGLRLNSLRVRILLVVLLFFVPIFFLIVITALDQQRLAFEEAQEDALALTESIAADNQQYIQSARQLLTTLAQVPAVREKRVDECSTLFARLLAEYEIYSSMFVVDTTTGLGICSAVPYQTPVDNTQFPWYQAVLNTGGFVSSGYRIGPVTGRAAITMALPVLDDDGVMTAVVAAGLSLEWLNRWIITTDLPPDTTITLLDQGGTVLARYPEGEGWVGQLYQNERVRTTALAQQRGAIQSLDSYGFPRLYGHSRVSGEEGNIHVIIGLSEPLVFQDVVQIRDRNLLVLVGSTVLVIIFAWVSSGLITRPIKNLTDASRRIADGQLSSRPHLKTHIIELEQLLNAFNVMAARVEGDIREQMRQLSTANDQMQILQEVTTGLSEAVTMDQVAHAVIERGLLPMGFHRGVVGVLDDQSTMTVYHRKGVALQKLSLDTRLPITDAVKSERAVWIFDQAQYRTAYGGDDIPHVTAAIPVCVEDRVIGALGVHYDQSATLPEDTRDLLMALAHQCAIAIERARLYETERSAREEAEAANQLKTRFLAMVSHELRTPLTSIKGFVTTLLADDVAFSPEEQRHFLNIVCEETDKLTHLIEQLLNLTRIQSGSLPITQEPQPLRRALSLARTQLDTLTKEHSLLVEVPADLPMVNIDSERVAQVLVNLVGNAVKFSPANTPITIRAHEESGQVRVDVIDKGVGIPQGSREIIFESFRQADRKMPGHSKGAGLGLAICKGLVEAHGGKIWVEASDAGGTTLSFTLPLAVG